ncbi:MAG: hypothetical protein H7196_00295 [candidate division SR1 bacterium]|nr:hypothetical protein [candidate division SR1 bacterium]
MIKKSINNAIDDWFPVQEVRKSENIVKEIKPKIVSKIPEKSESQKQEKLKKIKKENVVLRSKTFDLPINLITFIKVEAASRGLKEYQIALEAFEKFFNKKF